MANNSSLKCFKLQPSKQEPTTNQYFQELLCNYYSVKLSCEASALVPDSKLANIITRARLIVRLKLNRLPFLNLSDLDRQCTITFSCRHKHNLPHHIITPGQSSG